MAIGAGVSIGATDIALRAADKPILMGRNWQRESTAVDPWWNQTGSWAGIDETDSAGPTVRVYDEFDHLQSFPDANQATWYLLFDFGAAVGVIDSVAILNHNLNTASAVVDIQVADDSTFATNLKTLESQTPSDDKRLVFLDLDDTAGGGQLRYSNVQYARIKLTTLGAVPKIGEVIWSRRRQLKHKPSGQWDKSNFRSAISRFESSTGIMTDHVFHKNRRRVSMQLSPHETANIDDLTTFFETEIDGGTLPFILIDDPGTSPTDANWLKYETPEQISPLIGFSQRSFPIVALEQGPNFLKLGT
jgi:hypothetical protein